MNENLNIMLQLQKHWRDVLAAEKAAADCSERIEGLNEELAAAEKNLQKVHADVKRLESEIKQAELELASVEDKSKQLAAKEEQLKSEKELAAFQSQQQIYKSEAGRIEEQLIGLMDEIDALKETSESLSGEFEKQKSIAAETIDKLSLSIQSSEAKAREAKEKYGVLLPSLSPEYRSRFDKLLKGKGFAAGELNGEACSLCNCVVPSQLVAEAGKAGIAVCTNCGAYIYKKLD